MKVACMLFSHFSLLNVFIISYVRSLDQINPFYEVNIRTWCANSCIINTFNGKYTIYIC